MAKGKRYITPEGYRRLGAELDDLWQVQRPHMVDEVATAAAHGDRSENAEYIYGKKRLREIDRRMRFLTGLLDRLTVVRYEPAQAGRVFFGAWVTLEDEEGEERTWRIVGPDETDAGRGLISVEAPLARAILGKREGDTVAFRRPNGPTEVTIVAIAYEDAKDEA